MTSATGSSPTTVEVTILLPAYNEEESIGSTIREIRQLYPDYEILVIDDGSTDKTRDEAVKAGANVMRHPHNIGNGAAIKTGLRYASGEWILMMDADGQHKPIDIARLVQHTMTWWSGPAPRGRRPPGTGTWPTSSTTAWPPT
jgi:glycosyltransferase involved in cell wall biosynthesis